MEWLYSGTQASKFLQICKFDKNGSMTLQQRLCNPMDQSFSERFPLHRIKKEKFELNATSADNPQFDATQDFTSPMENFIRFLDVLYRFIRPYAAVGTVSFLTTNLLISDFFYYLFRQQFSNILHICSKYADVTRLIW